MMTKDDGALSGSRASTEPVPVSAASGFDPARVECALRGLISGQFSSITLSFNDGPGPNYTTVKEMDEDGGGHGDWVSDEERLRAYELNSEWVLQWYPQTPVGFCAIRASSLAAIFAAIAMETRSAETTGSVGAADDSAAIAQGDPA